MTKQNLKLVTAIVLGANGRGKLYGDYSLEHPEDLQIIGIAELVELRRNLYGDKYQVPVENRVATWEEILSRPKFADAVIIATPDHLHYAPCMKALDLGYDIPLEKPIAQTAEECRKLVAYAKEKGNIVGLTHVLRYSPYFLMLKEMVNSKIIGELISIQHFEPVEHVHMAHSYVRGSWRDSEKSTPLVLAKSSHDLDILHWIIGKPCKKISAFGKLTHFKAENAPAGAPERCTDGYPVEASCPYSVLKIYYRDRTWLYVFDLPEDKEQEGKAILHYLKTGEYGRCVYKCPNNQPDHYMMLMEFEEDITVNFSIEAFTLYGGRRTRIMGTRGDIVGDMEEFTHTDFVTGESKTYKANVLDALNYEGVGHGGGDEGMIRDWIEALCTQNPAVMSTPLDESLESHLMAFAAEESRKEEKVVYLR
ncbi:MAG: Gfo/Idh/MocA family oxidoreductase [Tannerellaceae bacterium]|nr:Gfo/Idh/MocA family oxidoreductase [Tannerellaceae bacterium]